MLVLIGTGFILAGCSPWVYRFFKDRTGLVLASFPTLIFIFLLFHTASPGFSESLEWVPSLGLEISIRLDGLSLLLALLVSGIGALVLIYGGAYLHGHPYLPRFYALTIFFMSSMLGVVVSENALLLFIFWELTSISSFLLIGFEHDLPAARAAAWQALLLTGAGGLAMLAGFILIQQITGSWSLQVWMASASAVQSSPLYPAIFWLVLAGAATKSAQYPFHFWLPNAMAAPTPVSAYLHSATMVKAGVYLLARLLPVLGGTVLWSSVLPLLGLVTLASSMLLMFAQHDLKRILAYSTVGALGLMVALTGLGSKVAVEALVVLLLAHGLYKGTLFLVAGGIDHAGGTRDVRRLGSLARVMPLTMLAAVPAGLSMAGVAPLFGFIAKELVYEGGLAAPGRDWILPILVIANASMAAGAGWVGLLPFLKSKPKDLHPLPHQRHDQPHENSLEFWLPPLLLSAFSLAFGLFPGIITPFMNSAAQAVLQQPLTFKLALWHGFTPAFSLSLLTLGLGAGFYFSYGWIEPRFRSIFEKLRPAGPSESYDRAIIGLKRLAAWQTRLLQSGYLRRYIFAIISTTVFLSALVMVVDAGKLFQQVALRIDSLRFYDVLLVGIILIAAVLVVRARSRLATIAYLGTIGLCISLIYLFYSAPDLAMVQIAIETLTVILFVMVISQLPKFTRFSSPPARAVDIVVSSLGGLLMSVMILLATAMPSNSVIAAYYIENARTLAFGRNVVNVTLVDFRGLDTLGEISVLSIAALGVMALLGLNSRRNSALRRQGGDNASQGRKNPTGMKRSLILKTAARYLMPLLLVFSIFLLLRGHNETGGGFVGGLVAAAAFMLYGIAVSPQAALRLLPLHPRLVLSAGLLVAGLSVCFPLFFGLPLMTGMWLASPLPVLGKMGTPVIFDVGVYLTVIGVTLLILLNLAREEVLE